MPSDARKLSDWLHRQSGAVQEILSHTDQLIQVNRAFRDWLREPWADTARIATLDGDTAVVYASDAATATLLRFRAPAIIAWVQQHWNPACTDLQIKVQPDT
ncbi:MAG: DciA family protein [Nevskiaceae bacterium]